MSGQRMWWVAACAAWLLLGCAVRTGAPADRDGGGLPGSDAQAPPGGCTPGEWMCAGAIHYQCGPDGHSVQNETTCPGGCDPARGCVERTSGCQRLDILFVVDISASMRQERENLAANFPNFIRVLDEFVARDDTAAGYRIGVTNSSINRVHEGGSCETTMGLDGRLYRGQAGCTLSGSPWIEGPGPGIAETFTCLANRPLGATSGSDCGKEKPLEVLHLFGSELAPGGANQGFYRRDDQSLLVIVNLTDEDEDAESTATPESTKALLDTLTGGADRYVVVTIAGPGPGECESTFGRADEATVLRDFTDRVPNSVFGNICEGDLAASLAAALEEMTVACELLPELI